MSGLFKHILVQFFWVLAIMACHEDEHSFVTSLHYHPPQYDKVSIELIPDTIHFPLNDTTYNNISSMNLFMVQGVEYLSIFDERSGSINIYQLNSQQLVKKILPLNYMPDKRLYKASVYSKNFDSIFISNNMHKLYMIDSSGVIKDAATFPDKTRSLAAQFEISRPLIVKDSFLYAGIKPTGLLNSLKEMKQWRTLYRFNLKRNTTTGCYTVPDRYRTHLFSYHFLNYSYCFNNRGNVVFSFPADSNLYETDLANLHIAHFGRSQFQQNDIASVHKNDEKEDFEYKQFMLSDAYGPVFFDSYHKRYCRVFRKRLSEEDFNVKKKPDKTMLIFNEALEIIGEWEVPEGVSTSTLLFTSNGNIYSRTQNKDENALHFVRLHYNDKQVKSLQLAQNDSSKTREP